MASVRCEGLLSNGNIRNNGVRVINESIGPYIHTLDRDPLAVAKRLEEYAAGLEESDA